MAELFLFPILETRLRRRIEKDCLRLAGGTHTINRSKLLDEIEGELLRNGAPRRLVAGEMRKVADFVDERLTFYAEIAGLPPAAGVRR